MPPKKSKPSALHQSRLAGINSPGTFATPRGRVSTTLAVAPVKQKSLTDCGFIKKSRDPSVVGVEAAVGSSPPTKRRKRSISFEVEETQLENLEETLKPLDLPPPEFHGNEDEVTEGPELTEEFIPHFSASSISYSNSSDPLRQPTSRIALPYEIPSSQTPNKEQPQRPVDTGETISHNAVRFRHGYTEGIAKSSEAAALFSESQQQLGKQKKISSSQEWENEDTQSKTLSTQASNHSGERIDEKVIQEKNLSPATNDSISRPNNSSQSIPKSTSVNIGNLQSRELTSSLDKTSKTTESESDKSRLHELAPAHVEDDLDPDEEAYDSDEGDFNDHGFAFKPVRTQQLPASFLLPQDLPSSSSEVLGGPPQIDDNSTVCDSEEDNDASNFSQLLPETLMDSFPMPPPLSPPESDYSASDTE